MHNKTMTNTELPQTMRGTLNNRTLALERTAAYASVEGGLNIFY